jgi:two-component system, NtrC family, response regulator HydG
MMGAASDTTHITNAGGGMRPSIGARVAVLDGPDAPVEVAIPGRGLTIGSAPECALRLSDRRVSRTHLHIMADGDGFRIHDLGSTNGTFLQGVRIENVWAPIGTTLHIGGSLLRLVGPDRYKAVPPSRRTSFGGLLGRTQSMREVFGVLERVVSASASVLIEGETGTGKEVVARALHDEGPRKSGPFVALDCGAIPESLIESELFGHVKGAFTGAVESRRGAFERAHEGTIFLDEIGELPIDMQPKLLRALESREIRRVGDEVTKRFDARIVAASNRDLEKMANEGTFRSDLFYRLAVVRVVLPPLRSRIEDLPPLIEKFLRESGTSPIGAIDGPNLELLSSHRWPGNVRELRNVLERAVACAGTTRTRFQDLPIHIGPRAREVTTPSVDVNVPFSTAKERVIDRFERSYLGALLTATDDNVAEASRRSGLNRRHLYDLLKKHGLRP